MFFFISRKHSGYFTNTETLKMVAAFLIIINLLAIFISLLTEVPFMNLEKHFLMGETKKPQIPALGD